VTALSNRMTFEKMKDLWDTRTYRHYPPSAAYVESQAAFWRPPLLSELGWLSGVVQATGDE